MSHRIPVRTTPETPIERIFEKVVGRKMTTQERIVLHLGRNIKGSPRIATNRHSRAA